MHLRTTRVSSARDFRRPEGVSIDIEHELVIPAPIGRVWNCFVTADGLNAWWTKTASADPRPGGRFAFGFDELHQWAGYARRFREQSVIEWEMTDTTPMPDWLGTRVGALLSVEGDATRVHFYHRGWHKATQHLRESSFCWANCLRVLARYCVLGEFVPYDRRNDFF